MTKRWPALLGLCFILLAVSQSLQARPAHKKALADYFGPFLPRHLNDCRTCHLPEGTEEEKPHNIFGTRLQAVRQELRKAGKDSEIADRLSAIAEEDSDGDGIPNLIELLSGHNPGEKDSKPTEAEIARARKLLTAFRSRKVYAWRPFEPVRRPEVLKVKNAAWCRNPIDAFIAADHELHDLKPRPEAPRHVLLRRVTIDLTGLPPTRAEVQAFLNDTSPDAYEKAVDRLLASPRYGERWGRHWMDVWRYVDYSGSGLQDGWTGVPHMWRWRDWIIASLNADKGYDRMVQEMLAADELAPHDPEALAATCYLARNKGNNRDAFLHDSINHSARAFLGVTLECARCHNHPYDRIDQEEYYRVRAIFEPFNVKIDAVPGQDKKNGLTRVHDGNSNPKTYFYIRGVEQNPDKERNITPGVPALLGDKGFAVTPVALPLINPERQPLAISEARAERGRELDLARKALEAAMSEEEKVPARLKLQLAESRQTGLEAVLIVEELEEKHADKKACDEAAAAADRAQRKSAVLEAQLNQLAARQQAAKLEAALKDASPAEEAKARDRLEQAKKALADADKALGRAEQQAQKPATTQFQRRFTPNTQKTSSGRRLAYARWITSRDNPLAARVAVNHIWLRHFGATLVPSVFDFGGAGQAPSHPGLLDWLAAELMDPSPPAGQDRVRGTPWSMKHLHRLIVTSATYRLSSTPDPENLQADPDNQFLWRMPSRRMEAEVVRDSIFHVAGNLDLTMRGPEIETKLSNEVKRRSIYFKFTQHDLLKEMEPFDAATADDCYCRSYTIVPQQALALLNSDLAITQSRQLARELAKQEAEPARFVQAAFEQVLARPATLAEVDTCVRFLVEQAKLLTDKKTPNDPALRARENLVHLLLNHHDFVTVR